MSSHRILRAALLFFSVASATAIGENLEPPTHVLGEATTNIVVADYKEAGPFNRIVFARVKVLQSRAEVPELIDIGKPDLREPLVAGKRYIIAYSPYAEDRFERLVVNSRGASFVSSPGMEPGLWIDTPDNRALVMWRIGEDETGREHKIEHDSERDSERDSESAHAAEEAMPRLLEMLASNDRQRREFAAAEIALRPALVAVLDGPDQKALQRFVASDSGPDRARAALLGAATHMPVNSSSVRGWVVVAVNVLGKTPVQTVGVDRRSSLILAALAYPPARLEHPDGNLQARWLHSDDIALVDAAALALQEMSVPLAQAKIARALEDSTLPADNQSILQGYQQRINLMKPRAPANDR